MAEYDDDFERTSPAGPGGGTHGNPSYGLGANWLSWNAARTTDGVVIFNGRATQFENFSFHTWMMNVSTRKTATDDQVIRFPITHLMTEFRVGMRVHDDNLTNGPSGMLDLDTVTPNGQITFRVQFDQSSPGQVTMIIDNGYQGPLETTLGFLDNTPHVLEFRVIGQEVSMLVDDVEVFFRDDMTLPTGASRRNISIGWAGNGTQQYIPRVQYGDYPLSSPLPLYKMPNLVAAGAIFAAATGTSITPVIPTTIPIQAGDILFFPAWCNASTTFSTPSGWETFGVNEDNANMSSAFFWKRAVGGGSDTNPTSTTSATLSTTVGGYGRIYVLRRCKATGNPFEDATITALDLGTTPDTSAIDTTVADVLVAAYCLVDDDNIPFTGRPPNLWLPHGSEVESTTGGDGAISAIERWMDTAGSVASVVVGTMANDYNRVLTLGWLPEEDVGTAPVLKRWNGSAWVAAVLKHGSGWPTVSLGPS